VVTKDLKTLAYTTLSPIQTLDLTVTSQERKYVLLPVWLFTYVDRAKGKTYYYAVNGQTGEASGIMPMAGLRVWLVAAAIVLGGAAALGSMVWVGG
jgi:hypothetical protein